MTTQELIRDLQKYPPDTMVMIESGDCITGIDVAEETEIERHNNDGGFDAVVLRNDDELYERYYE